MADQVAEWCECQNFNDGYGRLYSITDEIIFIHAPCGKPSFPVWQEHEKYCDECAKTFSSPVEELCERCNRLFGPKGTWRSWSVLTETSQKFLRNLRPTY